jgi:hypothetical protein
MKYIILIVFFLLPMGVHAAADLQIDSADIRFSEDQLISGDEVRIYATVHNVGDIDVSGYVSFYQGATLIGNPVVISLLADGSPEEVYVDFVVPSSKFNILALIQGTDPDDMNTDNNSGLTPVIVPIQDDDRDGVANHEDNCPSVSNTSQTNSDEDAEGDACDSDDDNDGLSDEVEEELHTSPTSSDTDGDGVLDQDDAYPTDPDKTVQEESTTQESAPAGLAPTSEAFQKIVEEVAKSIQQTELEETDAELEAQEESVEGLDPVDIQISSNAVFRYRRERWNAFTFEILSKVSDSIVYRWNFGDGVTSSKSSVLHVYNTPGAYEVTLTMTDETGRVSSERVHVLVPFFHLGNRLILVSVIALLVLLGIGIFSFIQLGKKKRGS